MDTGKGYFEPVDAKTIQSMLERLYGDGHKYKDPTPGELVEMSTKLSRVFTTGEEVELKGSRFIIHHIDSKRLVLKLLSEE